MNTHLGNKIVDCW